MRITEILKLSICIILIAIGGITYAGEKELLNLEVPLPNDIKIVAPAGNVPKDISAFSGVWKGIWTYNGAKAALIVEEINSKIAKVILSRGKGKGVYSQPGTYERYNAIVTPENKKIEFSAENNTFTFILVNDLNQIKGTQKTPVGDNDIVMTKVK